MQTNKQKTRQTTLYLLGEAGANRVFGVAERRPLKHGGGKLEHLPQEVVELWE